MPTPPINPASTELDKLKDVHELMAISWWPPAPGWWLLTALICGLLILVGIYTYQYWQLRRYRNFFLKQLKHIQQASKTTQLQQLDLLLKKLALLVFPREQVASLTGALWTEFLRTHGPKNRTFTALDTALSEQQFQTSANLSATLSVELWKDAEAWIRYVLKNQRKSVVHYRHHITASNNLQERAC